MQDQVITQLGYASTQLRTAAIVSNESVLTRSDASVNDNNKGKLIKVKNPDQEMDMMLTILRGQGLDVPSTYLPKPSALDNPTIFVIKSKVKSVSESGCSCGHC